MMIANEFLGLSYWQWIAGPSVALFALILLVTWTTTGTIMLIFLAGLQAIPESVEEAANVDGASALQRFRHVIVPLMRPTLFFVVTIGIIGHLAGVRPDLRHDFRRPTEDHPHPRVPDLLPDLPRTPRASLGVAIAILPVRVIMVFTCHPAHRRSPRGTVTAPATRPGRRSPRVAHRRTANRVLGYALLVLFAIVFIYPFVLSLATSFKSLPDIQANPVPLLGRSSEYGGWTLDGIAGLNSETVRIPRWGAQLGGGDGECRAGQGVPRLAGRLRPGPNAVSGHAPRVRPRRRRARYPRHHPRPSLASSS